ncbi:MAG: DUF4350 domain-containing protein, partial [Dehalococcoidia bacterium]|nr:DUF4350 domain-containing protein [Dehalococcoidia bacterium]
SDITGHRIVKYRERERHSPSPVIVVILSVLTAFIISLVCVTLVSSATDFLPINTLWNGLSGFAGAYSAEIIDSLETVELDPRAVLVTVPQLPYKTEGLERLRDFVFRGGTLVITDDYGYGNQILEYFGIAARFNGGVLLDPLFCYRNPALPRITDFASQITSAGVRSVVLNNATVLDGVRGAEVLARSSPQSYLELPEGWRLEGPFPVVARLVYGQGRVVLVADSSIFINSMLVLDDNRAFLDYLSASTDGWLLLDVTHVEKELPDKARDVVLEMRGIVRRPDVAVGVMAFLFALSSLIFFFNSAAVIFTFSFLGFSSGSGIP